MQWPASGRFVDSERIPAIVVGFGALLTTALVAEVVLLFAFASPLLFEGQFVVGVVTTAPFVAGIVFGGYWVRTSSLPSTRYSRILGWCFGGSILFVAINFALVLVMPTGGLAEVFAWLRWAVALGAGVGLGIGCLEGQAVERALAAERATLRAEYLEDQRDYLDYLNSVLRHEVLNTATVINGYAMLLRDEAPLDEQSREWADIVIEESDEMATVIDDVRVLLQTTDGSFQLEPVDLSRILRGEVRKLEHKRGPIEVETSIPDDVFVRADDLLARVFANLLANAVEHNDAATPRVSVTVDPGSDAVRVEIADNGPGIPDSTRESLFERVERRGSTHGLGLYLVDQLATRYDGAVELVETSADGSTFAVEIPAVADGGGRNRDGAETEERAALERSGNSLLLTNVE